MEFLIVVVLLLAGLWLVIQLWDVLVPLFAVVLGLAAIVAVIGFVGILLLST